jgi:hypothetical protein
MNFLVFLPFRACLAANFVKVLICAKKLRNNQIWDIKKNLN